MTEAIDLTPTPFEGDEPAAQEPTDNGTDALEARRKRPIDRGIRIEIVKDQSTAEYFWALYSANGKVVALCPRGYKQISHLLDTLQGIRDSFQTAPILANY